MCFVVLPMSFLLCFLLWRKKKKPLNPRPTRCFNSMTHGAGPAYRVQQGTPHVAPEIRDGVFGGVALVGVHEPQAATNNRVYDGHAGPTHVFGVHHLHAHPYSEGGPHVLGQLEREGRWKTPQGQTLINSLKLNNLCNLNSSYSSRLQDR